MVAGTVGIAVVATCPTLCMGNVDMLNATLRNAFAHMGFPQSTRIYLNYTPRKSEQCQRYYMQLRGLLDAYNHCIFHARSLAMAFHYHAKLIHEKHVFLLVSQIPAALPATPYLSL